MRKYTSKSQKIELYSKKYNIPEEEVNRILSEHEDLLTIDELKIKYDNPNIGKLPEWLTEESLELIIWKTIHQYWSPVFDNHWTKEELYMEHQEYIRKKIGLFQNHNHIKGALVNRMITLAQEQTKRNKYFIGSLDEQLEPENNNGVCRYKYEAVASNKSSEDMLFINSIRELKNKQVKNLLIVTGYLLCDIDELRKDYLDVLRSSDPDICNSVKLLAETIQNNEIIKQDRLDNKVTKGRCRNISIKDIIKALKLNITLDGKQKVENTLEDVRYYLKSCWYNLA